MHATRFGRGRGAAGVRRAAAVLAAGGGLTLATVPAAASSATGATGATVRIINQNTTNCTTSFYCFRPARLKVITGTVVTWRNASTAPHTVTRCTPAACSGHGGGTGTDTGLGSGTISSSGTYSFTFHGTGTYVYYCSIHGYAVMHGTVVVNT